MHAGMVRHPRVMIAAPYGRSGKTVVMSGIMRALVKRGIVVQPYKKGPDYIDPGWHALASGASSRTLDSFFMTPAQMRAIMARCAESCQVGIIEGAMGFYDGSGLAGSTSSAQVAKDTDTPVVLLVDVTRMTRTTAALVMGCMHFDPDVRIAGVIVNRVHGKRHEGRIRDAVEHYCGVPVLGAIPEDGRLVLPDRHLGLVTAGESPEAESFLEEAAALTADCVDLDALLRIAGSAPDLEGERGAFAFPPSPGLPADRPVSIAVVRDAALSFYYKENFEALEAAGARLTFVSSLADGELPPGTEALYIGGGFPEEFAGELQGNGPFRASVRRAVESGVPCCAECGGLVYLGRALHVGGITYQMAGAFDYETEMAQERQAHGYATVVTQAAHPWLSLGTMLKGHEHHHSRLAGGVGETATAYANERGRGALAGRDGLVRGNAVASYFHVNAIASPEWAPAFVQAARSRRTA